MRAFNKIGLYFHTLKYIKISQFFFLLKNKIFRKKNVFIKQKIVIRRLSESYEFPSWTDSSFIERWSFSFFGQELKVEGGDWNNPLYSKLSLYNLHYHDCLGAMCAKGQVALGAELMLKWIEDNPVMYGNGWEPYPLSLRIVNWVKILIQGKFNNDCINRSLAEQVIALEQQLEYHLLGNHIFENAKALVFAGYYFDGSFGERLLLKGRTLLLSQVKEQFLEDGGHFELSPMYHATLLWGLCDLQYLSRLTFISDVISKQLNFQQQLIKSRFFLDKMSHKDGEISFFNDAAFGIAPTIKDIDAYLNLLGVISLESYKKVFYPSISRFESSGYVVIDLNESSKVILDLAEVGASYQPGHAHADSLSFELSLLGERLFVNSGTSQYGSGLERNRQRSTAAHNTVSINDENSSEVWSAFRVAKRARVKDIQIKQEQSFIHISACHDGYNRLRGRPIHRRRWLVNKESILLEDLILGRYEKAEFRLYLHPDVNLTKLSNNTFTLGLKKSKTYVEFLSSEVFVLDSTWHPKFGESIANQCLLVKFTSNSLTTKITWKAI